MKKILTKIVSILTLVSCITTSEAQQISIIHSPSGFDASSYGYMSNPIEFQGKTYFRYQGNDQNYDLACYDGTTLTIINSPTGFDYPETGYQGIATVVGNMLYLVYKTSIGGIHNLAKYDGTTLTIIPNISGYTDFGLQPNTFLFASGNDVFFKYMMNSSGLLVLAKYDGNAVSVYPVTGYHCYDSPIEVGSSLYFRYQKPSGPSTSTHYLLGQFTGTQVNIIANPANYDATNNGYQAGNTFEYGGNLYMRFKDNSGQGNLLKYDGTTLSIMPIAFNHNFIGLNVAPFYKFNNKVYLHYRDATVNYYLAEFDGTTITQIPTPIGYQNTFRGYVGSAYGIDSILYLRYTRNDGGNDLAMYDGDTLIIIPSPTGYENSGAGYQDFPIALGNTLTMRYKNNANQTLLATYDNGNFAFYPIAGAQYLDNTPPVFVDSVIYTLHSSISSGYTLTKFNGSSNIAILNPSTHNTPGNGYQGVPFIMNGSFLMKFKGNDGNFDLAKLVDCSAFNIDTSIVLNGITLTANQTGVNYQWVDCNNGNAPINGETNQSFTPTISGNYAVMFDDNGCTTMSSCNAVTVVGIQNLKANTVLIYPNPVTAQLYIETQENIINKEIIDLSGRVVYNENDDKTTVNLANLPTGIYFIKLSTDKGVYQQKFVKN